jgi:hypothetical protein
MGPVRHGGERVMKTEARKRGERSPSEAQRGRIPSRITSTTSRMKSSVSGR